MQSVHTDSDFKSRPCDKKCSWQMTSRAKFCAQKIAQRDLLGLYSKAMTLRERRDSNLCKQTKKSNTTVNSPWWALLTEQAAKSYTMAETTVTKSSTNTREVSKKKSEPHALAKLKGSIARRIRLEHFRCQDSSRYCTAMQVILKGSNFLTTNSVLVEIPSKTRYPGYTEKQQTQQ